MEGKAQYEKQAAEALQKIKSHLSSNEGWTPLSHKVAEVEAFQRTTQGSSVSLVKATGVVDCEPKKLFEHIWSKTEAEKKKTDDSLLEDSLVEQIDDNTKIVYQRYACPWPVSDRSLLMLRNFVEENGTFYQVDISTEHPSKPESAEGKNVRAKMLCGGYVYEPTGDGKTKATYIVQMDPAGSLPSFIVNSNTGKVPATIQEMRDAMAK